ncbi:fibronectin/fibrinogen-binding protein [Histomonas meleagridis]|uniref:fibronectin/fibrinogen-binding protein n=1 Tax=Histomonas meleagridis TaxID=135588 RepID=UPI0035598B62|nr:fibronectin/fibrinogen-binding protein [Histomonas meleagridis]KAH0800149.1 fibronectin/fibrinogen-binding protein [Histomonas meleagridis]
MREFVSSSGIHIKVGENEKENGFLIRHSHQDFIWCHLKNRPSPHVVIESAEPDSDTISDALQLVKWFSKAKNENSTNCIISKIRNLIRVDYQHPGLVQLKKAPVTKTVKVDFSELRRLGIDPSKQ